MNIVKIVDGHSDYPVQLFRERNVGEQRVIQRKHLPSCKKGGIVLEVSTVGGDFSNHVWDGRDPDTVLKTIDYIHLEVAESKGALRLVRNKSDLPSIGVSNELSIMLNLEGATCVTSDFSLLEKYYNLGIRSMSLTHNYRNIFADGCAEIGGRGLSKLGKSLIKEINQYHMTLDLVHINERGFFEALDLIVKPPVVSHSNAKAVCNSFRNLSDEQLRALAEKDGVVGLNCLGSLIDNSFEKQTVERLLDHLDHIVALIGINNVGFGPDYSDFMMDIITENSKIFSPFQEKLQYAIGASNNSNMQNIVKGLKTRGYNANEIRQIMSKNFLRILETNLPD